MFEKKSSSLEGKASRLIPRKIISYIGLATMTAAILLRNRIGSEFTSVLAMVGAVSLMVFVALIGLSHGETRWIRVRRGIKLSTALVVGGGAVLSTAFLLNLPYASSLVSQVLLNSGLTIVILGILGLLVSFAKARPDNGEKTSD